MNERSIRCVRLHIPQAIEDEGLHPRRRNLLARLPCVGRATRDAEYLKSNDSQTGGSSALEKSCELERRKVHSVQDCSYNVVH